MSDEEFDENEPELEDEPDVDELDVDLDDDLLDDDLETEADAADDLPVDGAPVVAPADESAGGEDDDEDGLELDEELHPDDIEAPLDALLQERTAAATLEDDEEELEEEDDADGDDRVDGPTKIVPRRPGEFVCSSCFLVLPRNQLADEKRTLCRDCA